MRLFVLIFCRVLIFAGLASCCWDNLAQAQSPTAPDLAIESLTLDEQFGPGRTLRFHCVIRNRGSHPVPADRNVIDNCKHRGR